MDINAEQLRQAKCKPAEDGTHPLNVDDVKPYLEAVPGWEVQDNEIVKTFSFKNYYQTTSFVNAAVWIAHTEDHHAEITFDYKTCTIRYSTHSVGGLSANDFISAAKIDALLA